MRIHINFRLNVSRWLPLLFWLAVIFTVSANPDPYRWLPAAWRQIAVGKGSVATSLDELIGMGMHMFEYGVLAGLVMRARGDSPLHRSWGDSPMHRAKVWGRTSRKKDFPVVLLFTMLYALSDEIHQIFVPGRTFQLEDLALDLLGALAGLWLYQKLKVSKVKPGS